MTFAEFIYNVHVSLQPINEFFGGYADVVMMASIVFGGLAYGLMKEEV